MSNPRNGEASGVDAGNMSSSEAEASAITPVCASESKGAEPAADGSKPSRAWSQTELEIMVRFMTGVDRL